MIVPLFGSGVRSKSRVMDSQGRVNCYYEFSSDGDKTPFAIYGTPGLAPAVTLPGGTPVRGWVADGNRLFAVQGSTLYEFDVNMTPTNRGAIGTTSGRVSMATNGVQIMLVDGTAGWIFTLATNVLAQIVDVDFPANPTTVTYQDGFFPVSFREDTGVRQRIYINETAYDGTAWSALDFRNAESNPDGIVRVMSFGGELKVFGESTLETWGYTGAADFPFDVVRGATANVGLAARWSVAQFINGLAFLGKSGFGGVQVYTLNGYQPTILSTPELEAELATYVTTADASGYSYMLDSHPFYVIAFPAAGKTWMYDGLASMRSGAAVWTELTSNFGRYFGNMQVQFGGANYVADYSTGAIYELDPDTYTDNGFPIERELRTKHFFRNYEHVTVDSLKLDFETGVGLDFGQGENPQILLAVSRDGGRTFANDMTTALGRQGQYLKVVEWRRLGTATDFVFKIRMTDPVKFALTGAAIKAQTHE